MYWSRFCRERDGQYQHLVPLEPLNSIFCVSICLPLKNWNISIHQISGLKFWHVLIRFRNSGYPLFWDGIQNGFSFHDNLTVYYCPTDVPTRHRIKDVNFFRAQIPKSSSVLRPIVFAILRWARLGRWSWGRKTQTGNCNCFPPFSKG